GEQPFELLFVGLGLTLVIGVCSPLILLGDLTRVGLASLYPSAQLDYKIERQRRTQNFVLGFVLAGFNVLGDFNFLLPRKEREVTHFPEVETDGIRRLADRLSGRRRRGGLVGLFLDLGLEFALFRSVCRNVVEDLDVQVL